jgi:alkaline phosphatase D
LNRFHWLLAVVLTGTICATLRGQEPALQIKMPARGICAHRGASESHPENTLSAFREAIRLGAQMIEFDVALSRDGKLVLMHDSTVDRTTDGKGLVSKLTLAELKSLDAGSWKGDKFKGERIPTLDEALAIMPENIWLNVHLKGQVRLAEEVTKRIVANRRWHQAFLACGADAAGAAKAVDSRIMICNMERQANSLQYVNETIDMKASFIQLLGGDSVDPAHTKRLRQRGIRINYCCANDADKVSALFKAGVEFPLVDHVDAMLKVADKNGVARLKPTYRARVKGSGAARPLPGSQSQWRGFDQYDFKLDDFACRVVAPKEVAPGRPWIWRARFWGHEPQTDVALLKEGFHVAYCDVAGLWGNAEAIRRWDRFYAYVTSEHGFSRRPALEGMSRGGLMIYHWAIENPQQVSCIYGDAPALGIRPYVRNLNEDDPALNKLRGWMKAHGLSLSQAKQYKLDALDRLAPLAKAQVPVIHVCGDADESVPFKEHTAEFAARYKKLGGPIKVIVKKGGKHHPHSLKDPAPIVDFILRHQSWVDPRLSHGPFIGHATPASVLVWARCREPGGYRLVARSAADRAVATAPSSSTPARDGCVQWRLDGLRPGVRYDYQIEFEGKQLVHGDDFSFETAAPERSAVVRLAFGSCAKEDAGSAAVWRRMQAADPHAVVLLGDTPYIDSTELTVLRRRYAEFAAAPDFRKLVRNRPLYATWDDHDFGRNDTDGNLPGKENSRRAFIEYHANPSYGDGRAGVYTKFRRGGVEVFLLDTRYFASTEASPFDAKRPSLLGKQQWNWLRRELKASTAPFKVLACGMIWNGAVRPGKLDHWATYPHERRALFDFIGEEKIGGVILVGGDVHRTRVLRHRTTDSAGYKIPELITSPVHDSVIETANAPHPALIHDSGKPNTFLLITVLGDEPASPAMLNAKFLDKDGRAFFAIEFNERELRTRTER